MRSPRLVLVAALCVAALGGCSTSGHSTIPASISAGFEQDVRDIARLAAAHRYSAALGEVEALRTSVREALAAGDLGADQAARIIASLDLVETDLEKAKRTATPSSTPRPSRRSTPVAPAPVRTATSAPVTEKQVKKAEEARKKAAEEAKKEAEEARKKAEEQAKKQEEDRKKDKGKDGD